MITTQDLSLKLTPEEALTRRVHILEGALTIAIGTFSDDDRKDRYKQVYGWCKDALRGDVEPKVIDVVQAQEPKMLEAAR